jgi:hypothetical protein
VSVTIQDTSLPATSISGTTTICLGTSSTLTANGGKLGLGASWKWYSGSCTGTLVGSGTSVTVSPTSSTTYYLRAEGTCNNSICKNITITVLDTSTPAVRISGSSEICKSQNSTLSVSGGTLGNMATWKWYENSCGGTSIATGNSVVVSPPNSGTYLYYLRAEGFCNNTSCKSFALIVRDSSKAATAINGTTTICRGKSTTLTLSGGSLGSGASWKWYNNSCGGTFLGSGISITASPNTTNTYYVRAEGTCNQTPCVNSTIVVQDTSEPAIAINGNNTICLGQKISLNAIGGRLGINADWKWYTGSCGGTIVGSGITITVAPTITTTYYLRAEGNCNKTTCISATVTVQDTSTPAQAINGNKIICQGQNTSLTFTGGSLGNSANWKWYSNSCGGTYVGNGISVDLSPTKTTTYYLRAEGTCNQTTCLSTIVTVQDTSIPNSSINGTTNICIGQNSILTLDGGQLGKQAEWIWYSGNCGGTPVGKGTSITVSPSNTTKYFIRAEGICNNTICRNVTVVVNKAPKLSAINDTICFGEIARPSVSGGVTYEWNPKTGIDNPYNNKPYINYNSTISTTTTYQYYVKATDWNRCIDSVIATVVVNPLPKVDAGLNVGICPANRTLLKATGAKSYEWSPTTEIRTVNKDTASAAPKTNTVYRVLGTDINGCRSTDSVLVTVYPKAIAKAGKDDSICAGKSIILAGSGGIDYLWTGTNIVNATSSKPSVSPINSTNYILRVIDNNGCRSFDTVNISVIINPTPNISGKFIVCKNEQGTEFYSTKTTNRFEWALQNGKIQNGQGSSSISAHWSTADSIGKIEVTESLIQYPYCPITVSKKVKIGGTISPTPPQLVIKANKIETNIFICPNCDFEKYQWGFENKLSRNEISTCKDIIWCKYDKIDTSNNYYWVKVGADLNCQTKTYFNAPNVLNTQTAIINSAITIYPNPTSNSFNIESSRQFYKVEIYNGIGQLVEDVIFRESESNKLTINASNYSKGLYTIIIHENTGRVIKKILID